jgi:protoporphyrinogen oxidase
MPANNVKKVPLLILGAGMAGLGAAIEAQRSGLESLVLEADNGPGGLCRNVTVSGCDFDFGPKILLLNDSDNSQDLLSFLDNNYEKYAVEESVYLSQYGFLGFPLQRHLIDLPINERNKIILEIEEASQHPHPTKSYKDWLLNGYGRYLCEKVLFPYEEKKWQTSLDELDYKWALDRPVKVDIKEVKEGATKRLASNRSYYYPKRGNISVLSNSMARSAGNILFDHRVASIDLEHKRVLANGHTFEYEQLISTLPLDYVISVTKQMDQNIITEANDLLKRLAIRVFNVVFPGNYDLKGTAIYFAEKKYLFRRVSILQNLCPALARPGVTPISFEISINPKQSLADQDAQFHTILSQLKDIPQFAQLGEPIDYNMLEIDFAYPMQTNGLRQFVSTTHEYYQRYSVYHCGRGGMFDYCNSDVAFLQGKQAIHRLVPQV